MILLSASKSISRSSKEDDKKRGLNNISKQRCKEARLCLDDIDAIASSSHQVFIQPCQRGNGSKPHSLSPELRIRKCSNPLYQVETQFNSSYFSFTENQISAALEIEQPSTRISDPLARDGGKDRTPVSQKNPILVVPNKEQSHLKESDPSALHTGEASELLSKNVGKAYFINLC